MNLSIKKEFQNFEYYCKSVLNDQNPNSINKNSRSNLEILIHEIFCRSILLMIRFSKCCYTATLLALSPLSLIVKRLSSSENAWKSFSKELRYYSAEFFEMIGVIACSTLLLPFNRNHSPTLINAQIWVESTAEWISGERTMMQLIQKTLNAVNPKKELLIQARKLIKLDPQEQKNWIEIDTDLNLLLYDINTLKNRRIIRNYPPAYTIKDVYAKLSDLQGVIFEKIVSTAIPRQQQALFRLKRLLDVQTEPKLQLKTDAGFCLNVFARLSSEIKKTIEQLHVKHDPKNILKKPIESLDKDIADTITQALNDLMEGRVPSQGSSADWCKTVYQHYFQVFKQMREIQSIYQYENIAYANEEFSEDFVNDLSSRLFHCRNSLNSAQVDWKSNINPRPLDRQRALEILELPETANDSDIRRQYKKLVLIHHPDKGGKGAVFAIIKQAYDFLMKKDAP